MRRLPVLRRKQIRTKTILQRISRQKSKYLKTRQQHGRPDPEVYHNNGTANMKRQHPLWPRSPPPDSYDWLVDIWTVDGREMTLDIGNTDKQNTGQKGSQNKQIENYGKDGGDCNVEGYGWAVGLSSRSQNFHIICVVSLRAERHPSDIRLINRSINQSNSLWTQWAWATAVESTLFCQPSQPHSFP